jgi:Berberine and berberine like
MRPCETGATFVNFLVLGDWNLERTHASYPQGDWERLVELKNRYDPNNIFPFNRNIQPTSVGNSELEEDNLKPKAGAG